MGNPLTLKAMAFLGGIALASPAFAEDGLINNGDGTFTGFPSFYHSGHYCDTIQIYSHGSQHFGIFKDYPSKQSQVSFLQQAFVNAFAITFRITGPLQCKDSLGVVLGITDINAGAPQ